MLVAPHSFKERGEVRAVELRRALAAQSRLAAIRHRLLAARARNDTRNWVVNRRERTRRLIELGGLLAKSGLADLVGDDRAVIFGLLVEGAAKLREDTSGEQQLLWRHRGKRAFALDAAQRDGKQNPE